MKTVRLQDFLTDSEITKCLSLHPSTDEIEKQIILPNIKRINTALGQENDPRFLAYTVHYAIGKASTKLN